MSTTILTDSIGKYVSRFPNGIVHAFPGVTLERLAKKILNDPTLINLNNCYVLVHVGTNNLQTHSLEEIRELYEQLVAVILSVNPRARVLISSILPRAVDYSETQLKIRKINDNLRFYPIPNTIFLLAYGPFLRGGAPRGELYARDGLHLLPAGVALLRQVWITKVNSIYIGQLG